MIIVAGASRSRIPCHRLVLAEHSTSLALACSDSHATEICIPDWEPQILHYVLRYLYTGDLASLEFETLMNIYACAEDLGIECLMEKVLYDAVLEAGKWEVVLRDKDKFIQLVEKIFSLTAEDERRSYIYKGVFRLVLAIVQQDGLMAEEWFLSLLKQYHELGIELLKASLEGEHDSGVTYCFKEECDGIIGEWKKCKTCLSSDWDEDDCSTPNHHFHDFTHSKYPISKSSESYSPKREISSKELPDEKARNRTGIGKMCYHHEQLYTCGHTKRERRITCHRPRKCQMKGKPGIYQQAVSRTCGKKECEAEADDEEEEEDEEEEDSKNDGGRGGGQDDEEEGDHDDKTFKPSAWVKKQPDSKVTTRQKWKVEHAPPLPRRRMGQRVISPSKYRSGSLGPRRPITYQRLTRPKARSEQKIKALEKEVARKQKGKGPRVASDSDSSLSSPPSDEENPFGNEFLPKDPFPALEPSSGPTLSRRAKNLREQFQGLTILGSKPQITGKRIVTSTRLASSKIGKPFTLLPQSFSNRRTSSKRSIQEFMSSESVDQGGAGGGDAMEIDSPRGASSQRCVSEPVLKSAIRTTDYTYVWPGRVTRSITALQTKRQQLRDQRRSLPNKIPGRNSENSSPVPTRDEGMSVSKRVRFAAGSKETSDHMVLDLPDDIKEKLKEGKPEEETGEEPEDE
ncbi:hypothetical protein TWF173_004753 [Orbilia oligospora]|nr:hypothetical protein TWF173_004753 [Orbilia oligospora]